LEQQAVLAKVAELDERITAQEGKVAKQPHPRLKQKLAEHLTALQRERDELKQKNAADGL